MPTPKPNESEQDFVSRCVPIVVGEGATQEQALGKCYGMYSSHKALLEKKEFVKKALDSLHDLIAKAEDEEAIVRYEPELLERARSVEGFESPEPGNLPEEGKSLLAKVYAKCRKDGGDKEKCSRIAWSSVRNAGYKCEDRVMVLKRLEKSLVMLNEYKEQEIPIEKVIPVEPAQENVGKQVIKKYYDDKEYAKELKALFKKAGTEQIDIDSLIATQDHLNPVSIEKKKKKPDTRPIAVIRYKGKNYIYDGHHRTAVAKMDGAKDITARVVSVDGQGNLLLKAFFVKTMKDLDGYIAKAWELESGRWHDYDKNGNVIEVSKPGDGSKKPKKQKPGKKPKEQIDKKTGKYDIDTYARPVPEVGIDLNKPLPTNVLLHGTKQTGEIKNFMPTEGRGVIFLTNNPDTARNYGTENDDSILVVKLKDNAKIIDLSNKEQLKKFYEIINEDENLFLNDTELNEAVDRDHERGIDIETDTGALEGEFSRINKLYELGFQGVKDGKGNFEILDEDALESYQPQEEPKENNVKTETGVSQ